MWECDNAALLLEPNPLSSQYGKELYAYKILSIAEG